MSTQVTLEVSDQLLERARTLAEKTQRRVEDVLSNWLDQAHQAGPLESLSDADL